MTEQVREAQPNRCELDNKGACLTLTSAPGRAVDCENPDECSCQCHGEQARADAEGKVSEHLFNDPGWGPGIDSRMPV